ncbi:MAG: pyruvate dehydrogenase (acetyl-transferring), homodimeric type [Candidatus Dormibacteria bacterium]
MPEPTEARDPNGAPAPGSTDYDTDPQETAEWLDSFDELVDEGGAQRAAYLLSRLSRRARQRHVNLPLVPTTDYVNTIAPADEPPFPGDEEMERRIRRIIRWNAAAMVTRANRRSPGIGGHISTYASAASLYEVGFNHFFRGSEGEDSGDHVYFQGHAAPGIYARAYLEGRLTEAQLENFRAEVDAIGLSSYPHPRLMPDFWEFPTVSMGLGPLNAAYQARFDRYLHNRGIKDTSRSRVWCFAGDGEMDEPESMAAVGMAAREGLDNLVLVINCNLQRLDGPVRGNGKIIQELEGVFRGAGWNVIKVVWGREWDDLLANDREGVLRDRLNAIPDGEFQKYIVEPGSYLREHAFGPDPELRRMVAHLTDDELQHMRRGGHDYRKVYSAYHRAVHHHGAPTVILAKTVKGWVLGPVFEARNSTHQIKKLGGDEARVFRDRLQLPLADSLFADGNIPFYHPGEDSPEVRYLHERRAELNGYLPRRRMLPATLPAAAASPFEELRSGSGATEASTTGAFVRLLRGMLRDPQLGRRIVPIIPDEGRTFGMDPLYHEFRIYAPKGQLYEPVDSRMMISYREASDGQVLQEGISEAAGMASFTAAGTSYSTHAEPMIPFFIFYSMFGFQRVADLIWAFGDARGRGFLLGGTAGRTTLNGEGLQHQDGHSLLVASTVPNIRAYDAAFAFEVAVIVRDGMRRMYELDEDTFYYLALYNDTYPMPAMPDGAEEGIVRGIYLLATAGAPGVRARILASGPMVPIALDAQRRLAADHGVAADVFSVTSYQLLRNEAMEVDRWNSEHPEKPARTPYIQAALGGDEGPVIAVSDWMAAVPEQVNRWVHGGITPLGTDGYGRSDSRAALRKHFKVDADSVVEAVLARLRKDPSVGSEPAPVPVGAS